MNLEQEFKKLCNEILPKNIIINGVTYTLYSSMLLSGSTFRLSYLKFDGNSVDWNNTILPLMYSTENNIIIDNYQIMGSIVDNTIYKNNIEEIVRDYKFKLDNWDYEEIEEILSKDKKFHIELSNLLNKFDADIEFGINHKILANYLIGTLYNLKTLDYIKGLTEENKKDL